MKILVDHREPEEMVANLSRFPDVEVEVKQLEIGDYVIKRETDGKCIMWERKSLGDFIQSTFNKHLDDQIYRMYLEENVKEILSVADAFPVLVIENEEGTTVRYDKKIYGALSEHSKTLNFKIPVFKTKNMINTCEIIVKYSRRFVDDLLDVVKRPIRVRDYDDPVVAFYASLPVVGIGETFAKRLAQKYPIPMDFILDVVNATEYSKEECDGITKKEFENDVAWYRDIKGISSGKAQKLFALFTAGKIAELKKNAEDK